LSDNRANIDIPGSPSEHWQEGGENLPAAHAAKRARNCVPELAEIVVLERGTCTVPA
jgi:hypothetical protein